MVLVCWSVKGGSGTTVVAGALALLAARREDAPVVLVDLGGDAAAALGLASAGPGVSDWLVAGDEVGADALCRLEVEVRDGLTLLPFGEAGLRPRGPVPAARLHAGLRSLGADGRIVVVDAGVPRGDDVAAAAVAVASTSLLVVRPCYLALRRAVASDLRPDQVIVVDEPDRALGPSDVEDALGVEVRAVVPCRAEIARAVDAGLLAGRIPRSLASSLRRAV
ncbi:MAG TPA: cellulose synthase operon protein YhjQ/BcsQ [Acidimicrobiales bacterium]|nr:cellulose synthase operon protein YhjQ/BcsQ [Acidimicrobiales bacterium]